MTDPHISEVTEHGCVRITEQRRDRHAALMSAIMTAVINLPGLPPDASPQSFAALKAALVPERDT